MVTFLRSYMATAVMQPGPTGEPAKAPAWYFSVASAAVIVPSFLAPILTSTVPPEVGPLALNTSSRLITILTGRPHFCDRASATGSRDTRVVPPQTPPLSAGL